MYAIRATDLPGLRRPRYRKGRQVTEEEITYIPEWIADEVPKNNVRTVSVVVGPDILDDTIVQYRPDGNDNELQDAVSSMIATRVGNLALLAEQLLALPNIHDPNQTSQAIDYARTLSQ